MSTNTVPEAPDNPRDPYAELAATLHAIADDIATLAVRGLPAEPYIMFGLSFHVDDDEASIAAVDAAGAALLGRPGVTRKLSGGSYHHHLEGGRGGVRLSIYDEIASPEQRALREEIEALTAERDRLAAEAEAAKQPGGEDR